MTMLVALLLVVGVAAVLAAVCWGRKSGTERQVDAPKPVATWKDRGEARGRTGLREDSVPAHAAKSEPEASLHIKVIRKDGSIEHYDSPAEVM